MATPTWLRRAAHAVSSLLTVATAVAVTSQVRRTSGWRPVAVTQTLTPHLTIAMLPIALGALRRHRAIAALAAAAGAGGAVLAAPVVVPILARATRAVRSDNARAADGLRVGTVNLLFTNGCAAAIADDLLERSLDVIVFTEYTAGHRARLEAHRLAACYPHRVDREGPRALGVGIWSRLPLHENERIPTINNTVDVTLDTDGGPIRVVGTHSPTPVQDYAGWEQDLAMIRRAAHATTLPTLVTGDFNATYWHPSFRAILAAEYRDAHVEVGKGLTASWPVGKWVPPFALLDHVLIGHGLVATSTENFAVTGSDHRAVVVTVRLTDAATR